MLDQVRLEDVQSEHQRHLGFLLFPVLLFCFGFGGLLHRRQQVGSFSSWQGSIHNRLDESLFFGCIDMIGQRLIGKCW